MVSLLNESAGLQVLYEAATLCHLGVTHEKLRLTFAVQTQSTPWLDCPEPLRGFGARSNADNGTGRHRVITNAQKRCCENCSSAVQEQLQLV